MRLVSLFGLAGSALVVGWACSGEPFQSVSTGGAGGAGGATGGSVNGGSGGASGGGGATGGVAGAGGSPCSGAQQLCDGTCVNVQSNPSHCGACGQPCDSGNCSAGQCVAVACTPNATESCYTGPAGTDTHGICLAGTRTCNPSGSAWGPCENEVLPAAKEDCTNAEDDDCDGTVNQGCVPASCAAIKNADPTAKTGVHKIDPDGEGGAAAFDVHCDMDRVNGGWTRFNWAKDAYPAGLDPLGQLLSACNPADLVCRGRIPSAAQPKQLMVVDLTDNAHAVWEFDTNPVAQAALKALRDKITTCLLNKTAWMPSIDVSSEDFCGKGAEGGCDSFYYTSGGCNAVGGWGLMLDGDNFYCKAAFKLGATAGGSCGKGDRGYLNDCACSNETGELYYR